jgi:large subunit ribosomal protein L24
MATYKRLKTGDTVQILSGDHKGETAKITRMLPDSGKALLENIGERTRHVRANQYSPKGTKKAIHVGLDLSKLKLVKRGETETKSATKPKTKARPTRTKQGDKK